MIERDYGDDPIVHDRDRGAHDGGIASTVTAGILVGATMILAGWGLARWAGAGAGGLRATPTPPAVTPSATPTSLSTTATVGPDGTITVEIQVSDGRISVTRTDPGATPAPGAATPPGAAAPVTPAPVTPAPKPQAPQASPPSTPPTPTRQLPQTGQVPASLTTAPQLPTVPAVQSPTVMTTYVVVPGDTINKIARIHGVSIDQVVTANRLPNPNLIFAGTRLHIPVTSGSEPSR